MRAHISTLAIITNGRGKCVKRCLDSYVRQMQRDGRALDFLILDDSRNDTARAHVISVAQATARDHCVNVTYAGFQEKLALMRSLSARAGLPLRLLWSGLLGLETIAYNPGANRNWVPLLAPGCRVLTVDDDTTSVVFSMAIRDNQVIYDSGPEPFQIWFCPDHGIPPASESGDSAIALHDRLLGKVIRGAHLRSPEAPPGREWPQAKVAITMMGHYGDAGVSVPNWLVLRGASRDRLVQSKEKYEAALRTRNILRLASTWTVGRPTRFMTGAAGYDFQQLLPPFMPVLRNEDGIFAVTVMKCMSSCCLGTIPAAVEHSPLETRLCSRDELAVHLSHIRVSDIFIWSVNEWHRGDDLPECSSLRYLGQHLEAFGLLPDRCFTDRLESQGALAMRRRIETFETMLDTYAHKPDFWARDMEYSIAQMKRSRSYRPAELCRVYGDDLALEITRKLLVDTGRLYSVWPDLLAAASRMIGEGGGKECILFRR